MKKIIFTAITCAALMSAQSCGSHNDSKDVADESNSEKFSQGAEKDADNIVEIYSANMYEIGASEVAMNKASTAEIKKVAEHMVSAHTKLKAELEQLATSKNVTLPTSLTEGEQKDLNDMGEKSGLDFDKKYADDMEQKHDKAISKLESVSEKADDTQFREWAAKTLPEIRTHKDMIVAAKNALKDMNRDVNEKNNEKEHLGNPH